MGENRQPGSDRHLGENRQHLYVQRAEGMVTSPTNKRSQNHRLTLHVQSTCRQNFRRNGYIETNHPIFAARKKTGTRTHATPRQATPKHASLTQKQLKPTVSLPSKKNTGHDYWESLRRYRSSIPAFLRTPIRTANCKTTQEANYIGYLSTLPTGKYSFIYTR